MAELYPFDKVCATSFFTLLDIYLFDGSFMLVRMTIDEIRRENAKLLEKEAGGRIPFSVALGVSESRASQIIGVNPTKGIGKPTARKLEKIFGKSVGWMDVQHPELTDTAYDTSSKVDAQGEPIATVQLIELLSLFGRSDQDGRDMIMNIARSAADNSSADARKTSSNQA